MQKNVTCHVLLSRLVLPQALEKLFAPVLDWMAVRYSANVGNTLRKYGLRYEDLYDPTLNQVEFSKLCKDVQHQTCITHR